VPFASDARPEGCAELLPEISQSLQAELGAKSESWTQCLRRVAIVLDYPSPLAIMRSSHGASGDRCLENGAHSLLVLVGQLGTGCRHLAARCRLLNLMRSSSCQSGYDPGDAGMCERLRDVVPTRAGDDSDRSRKPRGPQSPMSLAPVVFRPVCLMQVGGI